MLLMKDYTYERLKLKLTQNGFKTKMLGNKNTKIIKIYED